MYFFIMKILSKFACVFTFAIIHSAALAECGSWLNTDDDTEFKECVPLAEDGDRYAQVSLGLLYQRGYGGPEHSRRAIAWFQKAADQGSSTAQYSLGEIYS